MESPSAIACALLISPDSLESNSVSQEGELIQQDLSIGLQGSGPARGAARGMRCLVGGLRSASLLACMVLLLAAPRPGSGQGLLLGGQLGSTPSLGRLLDPGAGAVPVSNAAGGDDGGTPHRPSHGGSHLKIRARSRAAFSRVLLEPHKMRTCSICGPNQ